MKYSERMKVERNNVRVMSEAIKAQSQQITYLKGAMLTAMGLLGVMKAKAEGAATEEMLEQEDKLWQNLGQYQNFILSTIPKEEEK